MRCADAAIMEANMSDITSFILNSALLGVGLAMDAFSVSMANGLAAPDMGRGYRLAIPLTFAFFQFIMPLTGWFCVRTIAQTFQAFQRAIPWIALILLGFIGGKLLMEGLFHHKGDEDVDAGALSPTLLIMQGIATSIDALSTGFTISDYHFSAALSASGIIAAVTFALCAWGLRLGRRFGTRLAGRASVLGGAILIAIGLEIFLKSIGN